MAYIKKSLQYDAIQYTGDLKALQDFGIDKFTLEEYKDKHIGIFVKDGINAACPVGDWIVKNPCGELEIVKDKDFNTMYQAI